MPDKKAARTKIKMMPRGVRLEKISGIYLLEEEATKMPHYTYSSRLANGLVADLPRAATRHVTDRQVSRLFAIARAGHWPREKLTRRMDEWFAKTEPRSLTQAQYDKLCRYLTEELAG